MPIVERFVRLWALSLTPPKLIIVDISGFIILLSICSPSVGLSPNYFCPEALAMCTETFVTRQTFPCVSRISSPRVLLVVSPEVSVKELSV